MHFAVYPEGTFYKRHLDVFQHTRARKISVICYLNFDWVPEDGGQLRIYLPQEDGTEQQVDLLPLAYRLVCFNSQSLEHEVLPARRRRYSITGWLKDEQPLFTPPCQVAISPRKGASFAVRIISSFLQTKNDDPSTHAYTIHQR